MKKPLLITLFAVGFIILSAIGAVLHGRNQSKTEKTQDTDSSKERLEISFRFHRGGIASSQYAIWIEDTTGRLVHTLYATSFTAKGGYEYREDAIPLWVSKAKPQTISSTQVDAITGATPRNGLQIYQWDGTDDKGRRVAPGKYKFFVEATLYWKSRVIYSGELTWGGKGQDVIPVKVQHFNQSPTNEDIITELKVCHIIVKRK